MAGHGRHEGKGRRHKRAIVLAVEGCYKSGMVCIRPGVVVLTMVAFAAFGLSGCVTAKKYRMAKEDTPPATPLGWNVTAPTAALTLEAVIVFKGPGSWKREARWDEYAVKLTNRGAGPLRVDAAALIDLLGQPQAPGGDPWALEKLSYTNWDKYGKTGLKLLAGAGAVGLYGAAVMASAYGEFMGGTAAAGGGTALLDLVPVIAVVDITAVAIMNHNNKAKVQKEFDRRRLHLPLTVAPGATAEGSFYFPMTPGPQRLIVRGSAGGVPVELVLDLKPLAGLHLKPAEKK